MLLAWVLVDVALRFMAGPWLALRPTNVAVQHARRYSPCRPNLKLYTANLVGEASIEANLKPTERRGPITFSTDRLGFRLNPERDPARAPHVLVLGGDSFIYGAALSDEETFPAALTRRAGVNAYNGGRFHLDADGMPELDWLLQKLPVRPKHAIFVYLEHENLTPVRPAGSLDALIDTYPEVKSVGQYIRRVVTVAQRSSPLAIMSTRLFKSLADDSVLPNVHKNRVRQVRLPDGTRMLFRDYEMQSARRPRSPRMLHDNLDRLLWCRDQLAARGLTTSFLLIPSRYTVYAPWLEDEPRREQPRKAGEYLDELERALKSQGITTLNALHILSAIRGSGTRLRQSVVLSRG